MKYLLGRLMCLLLITSGCATAIPYNYHEECALRGMKLAGVNARQGSVGWQDFDSEDVSCVMPTTDDDKCIINSTLRAAAPKVSYNKHISTKKFITATGYVLYIIPGVVAKILYDNQRSGALEDSQKIASDITNGCSDYRIGGLER